MGIKSTIASTLEISEMIKTHIIDHLNNIPINPIINYVGDNNLLVTLNIAENNLPSEFYDNKLQAKIIIKLIKSETNLLIIQNILEEIVIKGVYKISPFQKMIFNSQVRKYISDML